MTTLRSRRPAALLAPALLALALAGCGSALGADVPPPEVASVAESADGGPAVVTLSERAEERLGIATAEVTGSAPRLSVPYAAVVYDADGSSWVFTRIDALTYQRAEVALGHKTGDQVELTSGPPAGTEVVTVGAAELVGVETGIDGEE
jgi:hypothetical protein